MDWSMGVSTSMKSRPVRKSLIYEDALDLGVYHEVKIPLPVPGLDVREAVPLLGQRMESLCQQAERGRLYRELAGLCPEEMAFEADDIAHVAELEGIIGRFAEDVLFRVGLYAA